MLVSYHESNHQDVYVERYDSLYEATTRAADESLKAKTKRRSSRKENNDEWTNTKTFAEAISLAHNGWSAIRPEVERQFTELESQLADRIESAFQVRNNVVGGAVDVGMYLSGRPDCMLDFVPEPTDRMGKVVRIIVNQAASARVDADDIRRRGIMACVLADAVHKLGMGVEVYVEMCTATDGVDKGDKYSQLIKVHDSSEYMDVNNLMFAMAHPSVLRRLGFSLHELTEWDHAKDTLACGYGYPAKVQCADLIGADVVMDLVQDAQGNWKKDPIGWVMSTLTGLGVV